MQPPARGRTDLEQVMEHGRGAGVWGDRGRDPLEMVDDTIAEAVALTSMVLTSDSMRDLGFHGPSFGFGFSCISICWRR